LTEYERNVRSGLRAVRRVARRFDSQQELMDRILRRLYLRKTVPRKVVELQSLMTAFQQVRQVETDLERTLADWVRVIGS